MEGLLGKTLDKTYRIDQLLGKGGMGAVYKAQDIALNRYVAIKVMHPHFTDDAEFRARFLQEARAIATLDHPGIVQVYAFGQDLGLLYIVMDFIPGQTLHDWLRQLADERKIVALAESLAIVQQVALALHYAHLKHVLHRDIKPANIMLKPADPALREPDDLPFHPVLTDFGLAKLAEGGVQTQTGTSMGTPAYMSPEQCLGLELDHRADVYSLGVVLFELVTGRVPFQVKSLTEAIRRHTQEPPPPPRSINPTLPIEVENITLRTLAKRPEDRFASARKMADALKAAIPRIPTGLTVAPTTVEGPRPYVSLMTHLEEEGIGPLTPGRTRVESTAPGAGQVGVFIETTELLVAPGNRVTVSVTVFNQGSMIDHFLLSVEGIPPDWLPAPPPVVRLLPGMHQEVNLAIQPPRSPQSRAGRYPLTIRVASQDAPDRSAEAKATLTMAAYSQFRSDLRPQRIGAGKTAQVTIENQGNTRQAFTLEWQDQADELAFEPAQTRLTVAEGQVAAAEFRAAPRQSRWIGGTKTHPFSTKVRSPEGEIQTLGGEVISSGLIPLWVPPIVLFLCLLLAGAAALALKPKPTPTVTPTSPTILAEVTPTATITPTPAGTSTKASTEIPTLVPTLTPTPPPSEMVHIPAGTFFQGSTMVQIGKAYESCKAVDDLCSQKSLEDELTQRSVHLDEFFIDQHEVTNAQYGECVRAGVCQLASPTSSNTRHAYFDHPEYADYPVIYVTWHDADTYCHWAGKRLPTEAEWEKAARGTNGLLWPWGNTFSPERINFRPGGINPDTSDTTPVGSYPGGASPYGIVDMVGNVWEWVADWYAPSYDEESANQNPKGPPSGEKKVIRGGSWNSNIASARAASRAGTPSDGRFFDIGFRCAR